MVKTFVAAIVLTIGLGGYAVAQDTAPGSPAGTKPMTPEPVMHMHHHSMHPKHHDMAAPMAAPADAPNKKKTRAPSAPPEGETRRRTGFGRGLLL